MRLVQFVEGEGRRWVGVVSDDGATLNLVRGTDSVYALARAAITSGRSLESLAAERMGDIQVDYGAVIKDRRILVPLDHPDPSRCLVSGADPAGATPTAGEEAGQPAWFYKGDGSVLVAPERPLPRPGYAEGVGEEAELVGLYVIAEDGTPCRVGLALGNGFSDQAMARRDTRYWAASKLRACSFGPELLLGETPEEINGMSRIWRNNQVLWEKAFLGGESPLSRGLAHLEYHHFKYPCHRRPGDVHAHFLGATTLSFDDGIQVKPGDVFEVEAAAFGRPLRNPLAQSGVPVPSVRVL